MKQFFITLILLFSLSTSVFAQERSNTVFFHTTFQIYHIVGDHYDMVHFEGSFDQMSTFYILMALDLTGSSYLSLNSDGGYMTESFMLGNFLKNNPQITVVVRNDSICASACAFAAIGAKNLMIGKNGLEFHTPYMPFVLSDMTLLEFAHSSQTSMVWLMEYLDGIGYGIDFLNQILNNTNRDTFIVFYNKENINYFIVENFFDKIESENFSSKYEIITR